jgi:hypothetical protein
MSKSANGWGKDSSRSETDKRGGYPAGPRSVSELKPPPKSLTRVTSKDEGRR